MSDDLAPPWPEGYGPEGDWRNSYEVQPKPELEPIHHVMIGSWKLGIRIIEFDPENRRGGAVIESVEHVEPTHDPVDMVKADPQSALGLAAAMIIDTMQALERVDSLDQGSSSWEIRRAYARTTTLAQLAAAQATYATAFELQELTEAIRQLPGAMPGGS